MLVTPRRPVFLPTEGRVVHPAQGGLPLAQGRAEPVPQGDTREPSQEGQGGGRGAPGDTEQEPASQSL